MIKWEVVHECDEDDGSSTQWAAEIHSSKYGKYAWIDLLPNGDYLISSSKQDKIKVISRSLQRAKAWVTSYMLYAGGFER
jgi:hypothetical protein